MKKLLSSLIVLGGMTTMFWFDASPNGQEICNSSVRFATILDTDAQIAAATTAKVKFCKVVTSYPQ